MGRVVVSEFDKVPMKLADSKTVGDGVAILTYQKA
jgi:hypothetical protein